MKLVSVCGVSDTGKTTTVEKVVAVLRARGHRVGTVKEINAERFAIDDKPTSNTHRHRLAGAELVTARALHETDVLYPEKLPMEEILKLYTGYDWVVLEGVADIPVPTVVTGRTPAQLDLKWGDMVFCVSGRIADEIEAYRGVPAISAIKEPEKLVDFLEKSVYDKLPAFSSACCCACGSSCAQLGADILRGKASRADCVATSGICLSVDGRRLDMVPFVQRLLRNAILGVVRELDGYREGAPVEITL
ncbi:MAG: molybdopterin-guanine dinucleotide biosynthesis protein MobB [Oscillospiraceae bacterium]